MTVTPDRWTCPRCNATWVRSGEPETKWLNRLGRVQVEHAKRCEHTESLR